MSGNSFGKIFRVTTYGESHGVATGGVIDGCPAGIAIDIDLIRHEISRRKATYDTHSTKRTEPDEPQFLSGIFEGVSTGAPIAFIVINKDHDPNTYRQIRHSYRPGHGEYSWHMKYGHFDYRGGGRYSARETLARVIAGAIARQFLTLYGLSVQAWVNAIGSYYLPGYGPYDQKEIDSSPVRCPNPDTSALMITEIEDVAKLGDTLGGVVTCTVTGVIPGLGEPVFDKVEAELAKAMMSIPASKGFEMGEGFSSASMRGSQHNDMFRLDKNKSIVTETNHAGGTLGGITSGNPLNFRVAFKPVSSLKTKQNTITHQKQDTVIDLSSGRHDVCIVPRAVPVVEAMSSIVLADLILRNRCAKR